MMKPGMSGAPEKAPEGAPEKASKKAPERTPEKALKRAADRLRELGVECPDICVILGSGLSSFTDSFEEDLTVPYGKIPGFPQTAVAGHRGAVVLGKIGGKEMIVFAGRVHLYEGHSPQDVTFTVRLAAELGARTIIVTNASGGLDPGFEVGDLMLIADQLSLISGPRRLPLPTFRMGRAYSERLRGLAVAVAAEERVTLRSGVYIGPLGPTYETPAEIRMMRRIGGSAIGMSTVLEVQAARALGLKVMGIALITNLAVPGSGHETTHKEVLAAGKAGGEKLYRIVSGVARRT
ncbi:purine-nucleoside phosphorylase [bacterium]|nr:purine-nucleoside phosphorylase [bacterium]